MKQLLLVFLACLLCVTSLTSPIGCNRNPRRPTGRPPDLYGPQYSRFFSTFGALPENQWNEKPSIRAGGIVFSSLLGQQLVMTGGKSAAIAYVPVPGNNGMLVQVAYDPMPNTDPPAMQIGTMVRLDRFDGVLGGVADVFVYCDLPPEACEEVLRNGLPTRVVEALAARAIKEGWVPVETHRYHIMVPVTYEELNQLVPAGASP